MMIEFMGAVRADQVWDMLKGPDLFDARISRVQVSKAICAVSAELYYVAFCEGHLMMSVHMRRTHMTL